MDMTGERRIPAPRQKVWDALNDPAVLKACIPGCENLEKTSDTDMKATAAVKIGPIAARFTGKVQLTDLDPPNGYRISGEGQGGVAGFAKGGADVKLTEDGAITVLSYVVKAQVGGKIAQLGARLIDATSKQMADMFFDRFTAAVAVPVAETPAVMVPPPAPTASPVTPAPAQAPAAAPAPAALQPQPAPISTPSPVLAPGPAPMPQLSVWDLMPPDLFGIPILACVGLVLWLVIFFLLFKAYVFG